jgi:hypothetical protein
MLPKPPPVLCLLTHRCSVLRAASAAHVPASGPSLGEADPDGRCRGR